MNLRSTFAAAAIATCLAPAVAEAQTFENLDGVDRQVAAFLGQSPAHAGAGFVPTDRRLRLAACTAPLDLSWYGTRQDTVLVRCPLTNGWKLYVRVEGGAAAVDAAPAVLRGDAVTVTLRGTGFSVSQSAEALENGAIGDWIRVRMTKASEMRAQILQPGNLTVDMP